MTSRANPDQILSHLLAGVNEWAKAPAGSRAEREAAERVTACAASLDFHMRHGGEMPRAWLGTRPDGSGTSLDKLRKAYEAGGAATSGTVPASDYHQAFLLAFRALLDKDSEIHRLKAELDGYQGREVVFGLERYLQSNISDGTMPGKPPGTIARATDTQREWEKTENGWQVRQPYRGKHER
jgi:hypothetical protein